MMPTDAIDHIVAQFVLIRRTFQEAFDNAARFLKAWFPVVSEAHRAEVKRVHTMYRRKQKSRRRRR